MADTLQRGPLDVPRGPSPEELEARWREMMDDLAACPRDPEILVKAGQLSEQLNRRPEAFNYYQRALTLDPTKGFLVTKLRMYAVTPEQLADVAKLSRRPTSFGKALDDVFLYPVRGKGLAILIMGAVLIYISRVMGKFGVGPYAYGLAGLIGAYMAMFYVDICSSTAAGEDDLPDWPDPLRFTEFFLDWSKLTVAALVSFLPIVVIVVCVLFGVFSGGGGDEDDAWKPPAPVPGAPAAPEATDDEDDDGKGFRAADPVLAPDPSFLSQFGIPLTAAMGLFLILGLLYLPIATLGNVIYGRPWACINIPFFVRSIFVAKKNYMICLLAYFGTALAAGLLEGLSAIRGLFIVSSFVATFVELYAMTVQMRILGMFYRMNQAKLGWMRD